MLEFSADCSSKFQFPVVTVSAIKKSAARKLLQQKPRRPEGKMKGVGFEKDVAPKWSPLGQQSGRADRENFGRFLRGIFARLLTLALNEKKKRSQMAKPTDQLIQIVASGGNIVINSKPTDQLVNIVSVASGSGAHVTIKGSKPTDQLVQIARAGNGNVTFDLTD